VARRRLYWTARAVFVSDPSQVGAFDGVFREVFGGAPRVEEPSAEARTTASVADDERPSSSAFVAPESSSSMSLVGAEEPASSDAASEREVPVALAPSAEEVLRSKRFDELSPRELAALYRLMARLEVATPLRRTRRAERYRHGERIDLRGTLRGSLRTGGDPIYLRRRRRRVLPRRLVLLCDISGSMEPYARAYLQ